MILFIEIFFGFWFKIPNFGSNLRHHRLVSYEHESKFYEKKFINSYKRNSLAFRSDKDFDPSQIKIIFQGGSTANEALLSENETIVGKLNSFLAHDNLNLKIINASYDSKTTLGYVEDFDNWFVKIPKLNPKIVIFYTGLNDVYLSNYSMWNHYYYNGSKYTKFINFIENNSLFYHYYFLIQKKYFAKIRIIHNSSIDYYLEKYENLDFKSFKEASNTFEKKKYENINLISQYENRLDLLKKKIIENNITPVFITQFYYNGVSTQELYTINFLTKEFAKKNNFYLIKLDELVGDYNTKYWFYDFAHTTQLGSESIAKIIYPEIKNILESNIKLFLF